MVPDSWVQGASVIGSLASGLDCVITYHGIHDLPCPALTAKFLRWAIVGDFVYIGLRSGFALAFDLFADSDHEMAAITALRDGVVRFDSFPYQILSYRQRTRHWGHLRRR